MALEQAPLERVDNLLGSSNNNLGRDAVTQKDRRIKISTVLDKLKKPGEDDPLLPAMVQISEAISAPYYIDLLMYARRDLELDPRQLKNQLINTTATVSVRAEDFVPDHEVDTQPPVYTYQLRKGVFQSFQRQDRFHRRIGRDLNIYTARLVPAFLIMDQEVRYRIFEQPDMTFIELIQMCMEGFKGLNLTNYVDKKSLDALKGYSQPPPKMAHAVQYGESTFNFLSRLMNRFSIWYYFDHDGDSLHETMVLGSGPVPGSSFGFKQCALFNNFPDPRDPESQIAKGNRWQFVTGLARLYASAPRLTRTSDFNPVNPVQPIESNDEDARVQLDADHDIINVADGSDKPWKQVTQDGELPPTTFIQEQFPDSTIYGDDDATSDASTTLLVAQGQVFNDTASTRNATFCAARRFKYLKGDDNPKDTEYLVTRMSLNAYDRYYLQIVNHNSSISQLIDDVLVAPVTSFLNQVGSSPPDLANAMANAGLQEYTQSWLAGPPPSKPAFSDYLYDGFVGFLTSFLPSTTTLLQDFLSVLKVVFIAIVEIIRHIADVILFLPGLIIHAVKRAREAMDHAFKDFEHTVTTFLNKLIVRDDDACAVSFVAVPLDHGKFGVPLPSARNAQVFGPHLATVIGPNGADAKSGELWADALGRVRVRLPWDRTPWERTHPDAHNDGSLKPQFAVGTNTAWVRVSEAWAGQNFGTQFLPRVGQEVIVSFLDSDPDRPIITGRVYNANTGASNLPFPASSSAATPISKMEDLLGLYKTASVDFPRSGIETRSTPMPRDAEGKPTGNIRYHLLRFDDTYWHEQFLVRSQGRLDVTAKSSRYETTEGNRHVLVIPGKDKDGNIVGGASFTTVGGEYDLHVGKDRYEAVDGDYQLNVKGDTQIHIAGDCKTVVDGNLSLNAQTIVIEASDKITLRVGGSTVVLNPSAVWHDGPFVQKQGGGPADTAASVTLKDIADAAKADPGEPPSSRPAPKGGGGGKRGQKTYGPHEADGWTADYSGMVSTDLHGLCTPAGDVDAE